MDFAYGFIYSIDGWLQDLYFQALSIPMNLREPQAAYGVAP